MKDLCIPVPGFGEYDKAEIELRIGVNKITYDFRVESFLWDSEDDPSIKDDKIASSLLRITRLKEAITQYDKDWELIQIFTPMENSRTIQVLYKKKLKI